MKSPMRPAPRRTQGGAATLVVVMVLFFIMAMMAAYANRNLVFEQRIASNYYRAGVALEAAEAGAEWALGMLNGLNVNGTCKADGVASTTTSFRQRYMVMGVNRAITPINPSTILPAADCVLNATSGWTCRCGAPGAAWVAPEVPAADRMQPSFGVYFPGLPPANAGVVKIFSRSCTSSSATACLNTESMAANMLGSARVSFDAAFVSALKMPPLVPLTAQTTVSAGPEGLGLHNTDPASNGLLLVAGDAAEPVGLREDRLDSLPGTPGRQALLIGDAELNRLAADLMFARFFGMQRAAYRNQPAVRRVNCVDDCATALLAAYAQGVRMAWIEGDMTLRTNIDLGTASSPMLVVVNGNLTLQGPMRLNGLIYAGGNVVWTNDSGDQALLTGALISAGSFQASGSGNVDLWYQASVMSLLSNQTGSFVRVPGSWTDDQ